VLAAALVAVPAQAAPGDLDASFGPGGTVTTDFGDSAAAFAVALLSNGKLVVAGRSGADWALARYLPDGTLDPIFNADGKVTTDFGGADTAYGVAIQPNFKIVAVGGAGGDFALARYKRDGEIDPSFGTVTADFGGADVASAVALQADGKILVAGGGGPGNDFALARYTTNGNLDSSFSGDGKVTTDFGADDRADTLVLQADGRILTAGSSQSDFALARYNADGTLDTTFDGDGMLTTDFSGGQDAVFDVAVQSNTEIVAVGSTVQGGFSDFALARYNPDGSLDARSPDWPLDTSLDVDGTLATDFGGASGDLESASGVALQQNGKVVVAGSALSDFALARYEYDGSLDATFGTGGKVSTDFAGFDQAEAVLVQGDGGIVVVGTATAGDDFAVARYLGDPVSGGGILVPAWP
jgi:uncharacterized delta-60 repeat protein